MPRCAKTDCLFNNHGPCGNAPIAGPMSAFETLWKATGREPGVIESCSGYVKVEEEDAECEGGCRL